MGNRSPVDIMRFGGGRPGVYDRFKEMPRHRLERRVCPEAIVSGFPHTDQEVAFSTGHGIALPSRYCSGFRRRRGAFIYTNPSGYRVWLQNFRKGCARVNGCDPDSVVLENPTLDAAAVIKTGDALLYEDEHFNMIAARYVFEHKVDPEHTARDLLRIPQTRWMDLRNDAERVGYVALASRLVPNWMHQRVISQIQPRCSFRLPTHRVMPPMSDIGLLFFIHKLGAELDGSVQSDRC